ncbi:MAG: hypothetical protein ACFFE4_00325 [Candidatus Thorarchaeota archaeon]
MNLYFFIRSQTINLDNYTIKDIPGSSGRLDVISRCILAALLGKDGFEKNVGIWVFLDNYGTYIFNSNLNYENFPKNELMLTDHLVKFLRANSIETMNQNPFKSVKSLNISIVDALKWCQFLGLSIFVLKEGGKDFLQLKNDIIRNKNIIFIIGSQEDEFLDSKEFLALKLPIISMGTQSYLASSVIRLLKLHLLALS